MSIDSVPQACPRCQRPTVLVSRAWGRQWVHVGTWRPQCGAPSWAARPAASGPRPVPPTAA